MKSGKHQNSSPLHLQGVASHILWILPTFLGIIPDTSRQQERLYHRFSEVGEMEVKVIGSCPDKGESESVIKELRAREVNVDSKVHKRNVVISLFMSLLLLSYQIFPFVHTRFHLDNNLS